jgi:hypothetical protein
MTAPILIKTVSKKRREWLRVLKVGDQVALWDGISWSDAKVIEDHGGMKIEVKAVNHYPCAWISRTRGYDLLGQNMNWYIGPIEDHKRVVEVDEAKREIRDAPFRFDEVTDDAIVQAANILRAGKRAP